MARTVTLGSGIYGVSEAAYLLGIDSRHLVRWAEPASRGEPALLRPTHKWAYSFHDLVSLAVIGVFFQRGIKRIGARRAIQYLQTEYGVDRPLADKRVVEALATADAHIMWQESIDLTRSGQLTLVQTLRSHLVPIEYGSDLLARLWRPAPSVILNPAIQAGKPCIEETRVTTDVVAARIVQGESRQVVADDLGLTRLQVGRALKFEERLQVGNGLAFVAH